MVSERVVNSAEPFFLPHYLLRINKLDLFLLVKVH